MLHRIVDSTGLRGRLLNGHVDIVLLLVIHRLIKILSAVIVLRTEERILTAPLIVETITTPNICRNGRAIRVIPSTEVEVHNSLAIRKLNTSKRILVCHQPEVPAPKNRTCLIVCRKHHISAVSRCELIAILILRASKVERRIAVTLEVEIADILIILSPEDLHIRSGDTLRRVTLHACIKAIFHVGLRDYIAVRLCIIRTQIDHLINDVAIDNRTLRVATLSNSHDVNRTYGLRILSSLAIGSGDDERTASLIDLSLPATCDGSDRDRLGVAIGKLQRSTLAPIAHEDSTYGEVEFADILLVTRYENGCHRHKQQHCNISQSSNHNSTFRITKSLQRYKNPQKKRVVTQNISRAPALAM